MANIGLFFPNRCATGITVSGGSWQTSLPVSNVADPRLSVVARSTDDATASTKIRLDLGQNRVLRAFALVNHNLTNAAQWRVLLGSTSGGSDVFAGTLADYLVSSIDTALEAKGMDYGVNLNDRPHAVFVLPSYVTARHVTIEIEDTSNPDGYVQIGRVFVGGGLIPEINPSYGTQDGFEDLSTTDTSESGEQWVTARRRLKTVRMVLSWLTLEEGDQLHEMMRVLGTIDEVLYVPDVGSMAESQRYGMLGTLSELSALSYPYSRRRSLPILIKQKA